MSSLNDKIFSPASDLFQIIVPVYNEKSILETTLGHAKGYGYLKNLVVVNDASTDTTRDILDQWLTEESLRVLHLDINKKKEGAIRELMVSLQETGTLRPYTVLLDADTYLQSTSQTETVNEKIEQAITQSESGKYSALALRLNAVYLKAPSIFWMSAFTTYIGIQFDNWLLSKQAQLWVINGAAGIFKSSELLTILDRMEFTFETGDLQITLDLMKERKPIAFHKDIIANSYVPSNLRTFFNQRRRWERGTTKVLFQDRRFYFSTFLTPSYISLSLIIHLSIYISFWVAIIFGAMDNYNWNWGLKVFLGCYVGWLIFDLFKGFWVIHKEGYKNFLLYFLCEVVNGPVNLLVIIPARLFGGAEGLLYLTKKCFLFYQEAFISWLSNKNIRRKFFRKES